jgi:exodeoxyribonuclease VII small subunit
MSAQRAKKGRPDAPVGPSDAKRTFEAALERLEEIVDALEQGTVPLEKALELYQEGATLSKECADRLKAAEQRIMKLSKNADGTFMESSLDDDE